MTKEIVMRTIKALLTTVLCFVVILCPLSAYSSETSGSITLSVTDKENKTPVSDASIKIYKFAATDKTEEGFSFSYNDDFRLNGMDISEITDTYFPVHLTAFAEKTGLPFIEKNSDLSGNITYENLEAGAYLVVPANVADGYLTPSPFVVTIPMKNSADDDWNYHIDASPKVELVADESIKTYLSVTKHWVGTENHPSSVQIALMKDSVIVETVILDETNNWQHKWENLDKNHSWFVTEIDIPQGYTVSYDISEMTVKIFNTAEAPSEEETTGPDELIHTGQLNWPVPVFAILGLLLFSIGWALFTFCKKEEDAV